MESTQEICNKITENLGSFEATNRFVEFVDLFSKPEHQYAQLRRHVCVMIET
jgi:hypothetical protein